MNKKAKLLKMVICIFSIFIIVVACYFAYLHNVMIPVSLSLDKPNHVFDKLIAYSESDDVKIVPSYKSIFDSNLISDEDKKQIIDYSLEEINSINLLNRLRGNFNYSVDDTRYYVAIGIKDSKDIVYIFDQHSTFYSLQLREKRYEKFEFESNLDYSFDQIVQKFEKLIGCELDDAFFEKNYINLRFEKNNNEYIIYYSLKYDDVIYTVYM